MSRASILPLAGLTATNLSRRVSSRLRLAIGVEAHSVLGAEGGFVRSLQREKLSSTGSSPGIGREIGRNIVQAQDILESVVTFDKLARDT